MASMAADFGRFEGSLHRLTLALIQINRRLAAGGFRWQGEAQFRAMAAAAKRHELGLA